MHRQVIFMQSVIYGVLQEEKQRNLDRQEMYKQEIDSLRKGSIKVKYKANRPYYYLQYRVGNKVVQDYIGKDEKAIESVKQELEKRKYLQSVLKRLQREHKEISKIVKG